MGSLQFITKLQHQLGNPSSSKWTSGIVIVTAQLKLNSTRVGVTTLLPSHPPTHTTHTQTFKALPGNLGS